MGPEKASDDVTEDDPIPPPSVRSRSREPWSPVAILRRGPERSRNRSGGRRGDLIATEGHHRRCPNLTCVGRLNADDARR